jgi:CheY-like chemotaxis protein
MRAFSFIVGPPDGPGAALMELAQTIGFAGIAPFTTIARAEQQTQVTPICFFLFAATEDVGSLRGVADAIRFNATRRLRFSPLIYFSESPSADGISACLNMGFDDIITMPFTPARVKGRIERQVGQSMLYYETATYFGPDRRHSAAAERALENRGGGRFRRLEIVRNLRSGINVLREDNVNASAA